MSFTVSHSLQWTAINTTATIPSTEKNLGGNHRAVVVSSIQPASQQGEMLGARSLEVTQGRVQLYRTRNGRTPEISDAAVGHTWQYFRIPITGEGNEKKVGKAEVDAMNQRATERGTSRVRRRELRAER